MIIHVHRHPTCKHVRQYSGAECSKEAAIEDGSKDGDYSSRDVVLPRQEQLNSNGNEVLDTNNVDHRPLCT